MSTAPGLPGVFLHLLIRPIPGNQEKAIRYGHWLAIRLEPAPDLHCPLLDDFEFQEQNDLSIAVFLKNTLPAAEPMAGVIQSSVAYSSMETRWQFYSKSAKIH